MCRNFSKISGVKFHEHQYYYYYYYYYYYLLQLSFHAVPIFLTLVQTKQIGINMHKRNNTKYSKYKYTY
jgi:hypothetical protein